MHNPKNLIIPCLVKKVKYPNSKTRIQLLLYK